MPHSQQTAIASISSNEIMRKLNVVIRGQGEQTLVFGHGFGCDQDIWARVAPAFLADYRVVLFDYVGCGRSDLRQYDQKHYSDLSAYADDLIVLCEALEIESAYFIGHSVSGAIGMLASISRPKLFTRLITIGPSPCYINHPPSYFGGFDEQDVDGLLDMMHRNYFEWTDYLAPIVVGNSQQPAYADELKLSFLRADPVISQTFAKVTFHCDIRQQVSSVPVPVIVLYCSEDIIVPLEVIAYLEQNLPKCKAIKLNATGHYPQITEAQAVIDGIKEGLSLYV